LLTTITAVGADLVEPTALSVDPLTGIIYAADLDSEVITQSIPTVVTAVRGDPQFVGLRGQSFQVHGIDGAVYSITSEKGSAVNARFAFLSGPRPCPSLSRVWGVGEQPTAISCWSHDGSYLSELALFTPHSRLFIEAGSAARGFMRVELDGQQLRVGQQSQAGTSVKVEVHSSHHLTASLGSFIFRVENSDGFVNLAGVLTTRPLSSLTSHGLLGQTWQSRRSGSGALSGIIEGDVDDYSIRDDEIFGTDFPHNQYEASSTN
jgi:hypothetical protein